MDSLNYDTPELLARYAAPSTLAEEVFRLRYRVGELESERETYKAMLDAKQDAMSALHNQWAAKWEHTIDTYSSLWHKAEVYRPRAFALLKQLDKWRTRFDSLAVQQEHEHSELTTLRPRLAEVTEAVREWMRYDLLVIDYWDEDLDEEEFPSDSEIETQRQKAISVSLIALSGKSDPMPLSALRAALQAAPDGTDGGSHDA